MIQEVSLFYTNIRRIINEREENQKTKIKEQMQKEEVVLNIQ